MSTFNLVLTLYEERRLSVAIKNWLGHLAGAKNDAHVVSESTLSLKFNLDYLISLQIGPEYSLEKRKLFRSDSGTTLSSFHL